MMKRIGLGAALVAAVLLVGCAYEATGPQDSHFAGVIVKATDRSPTESNSARIWVTVDPPTHTDAAGLHIWPGTRILVQQANGSYQEGSVHDLVEGARYRAWHDGIEMRSLPPQYNATRIEVW